MPLSVHDEFRKPPMRSRSTKSSASGLAYSSTLLSINEIGVSVRAPKPRIAFTKGRGQAAGAAPTRVPSMTDSWEVQVLYPA